MIINTLQDLVKMMKIYRNPYLIQKYKGTDWNLYVSYKGYNEPFMLTDNLYLISCIKNQKYKINTDDYINVLKGSILVDGIKIIDEEYFYSHTNKNQGIYEGYSLYNTFLHYKHHNHHNHNHHNHNNHNNHNK